MAKTPPKTKTSRQEDRNKLNVKNDAVTNNNTQLIVLFQNLKLSCWQIAPNQPPKTTPIKGEEQLHIREACALDSAIEDLTSQLIDKGLIISQHIWVVDNNGQKFIGKTHDNYWLITWEWLAQRFGITDETQQIKQREIWDTKILPWIISDNESQQRQQLKNLRDQEHANETARLTAERLALLEENKKLRAQHDSLKQLDQELLARFLPALYPSVFTALSPTDLALLCGRIEPPNLPNPYPEPTAESIHTLQKNFRKLSLDKQKEVIRFTADLPHFQKLKPRPEMRELIAELQEP